MSHHLDSPASRRDPRLNVTDLYAFDGHDATVLMMIVNSSLAGVGRPAGFHPEGRYEFNIHLDGAATEQLTYRLSFAPADASGTQHAAIDRFYLDLHHLTHILEGLQNEQPIDNGEWTPAQAANTFAGSQICAIVLEIPHSDAELRPGRPIAVWA